MNNAVCRMVGCEFPLFAFSHFRDGVVAVSKAGGFGVLGATPLLPSLLGAIPRRSYCQFRAVVNDALCRHAKIPSSPLR